MKRPGDAPIFDVDLQDFESKVIEASRAGPILVDFWADWCSPCHAIAPHLKQLIADLDGRVRLAKCEVDEGENMKLAGRYRLRGFPTVMLFQAGEEVGRFASARPVHWIREWLESHLPDI
jgi:thioredoxin 1